jgi:hypothetical protein
MKLNSNLIFVVLILLLKSSLSFSQSAYLVDETSYINNLAYKTYPIINVKQRIEYHDNDLTPFSQTNYKKDGVISGTIFWAGGEKIKELKPKQTKALNDILNQTKKNDINSKNDKYDERKRLVYYVRESSIFEYRTFNNYDDRDSLILTTTYMYKKSKSYDEDNILLYTETKTFNTIGLLEKKQLEYSVEFKKNQATIWYDYGTPINKKINYFYLNDGLVNKIEVYDDDNNLIENLTSYYDIDKENNLINSIKIVNKKGETESFESNKYKF